MKFVYIHGFNSAPNQNSDKVTELIAAGYDVQCVGYDSFSSYEKAINAISSQIDKDHVDDLVFIGTSLGAYYSAAFGSMYSRPFILINPAIDPRSYFNKRIGKTYTNYKQSFTTTGIKTVYAHIATSYEHTLYDLLKNSKYKPLLLLDAGDEIFDSFSTASNIDSYLTKIFEFGNHRFSHMKQSIPYVKEYLCRCEALIEVSD